MKVYNSVTIDMESGSVLSEDSYEYKGPVALCGGKGGGGSTSTQTVTKSDPWSGQQPYLTDVFSKAQGQYNTGVPSYFPGSTVTPFSPETQQAMAMQSARATNGSPIMAAGGQQLTDTLQGDYLTSNPAFSLLNSNAQGDYLNKNPYIDQTVDRALGKVRGSLDSQFAQGGRYGSGLHQTALAGAYGDTAASMYGQNYANERQNQLGATNAMGQLYGDERTKQLQSMMFAPQMANHDYVDAQQLAAVGGAKEGMSQANINDQLNRWNFDQNKYSDALARYNQLVQGNYGGSGSSTSTSPTNTNRTASMLGGGLSGMMGGAMLGSLIPGMGVGGVGAGILPTLGGLGGLMLSDRRLKKDIKAMGKLDNGLTVYSFRYKMGGPVTMGVMADEVKKVIPEAVQTVGGVDFVNYGRL